MYIAERLTLLSAIARSMDDSKRCCGLWYVERELQRNMTADRSGEKLILQRSQNNVLLYGCSCDQRCKSLEYYSCSGSQSACG